MDCLEPSRAHSNLCHQKNCEEECLQNYSGHRKQGKCSGQSPKRLQEEGGGVVKNAYLLNSIYSVLSREVKAFDVY